MHLYHLLLVIPVIPFISTLTDKKKLLRMQNYNAKLTTTLPYNFDWGEGGIFGKSSANESAGGLDAESSST